MVILSQGTLGDLFPLLGLGQALHRLGHRVTVLAAAPHMPHVQAAGLGGLPLGTVDDYHRVLQHPDLWQPSRGYKVVLASAWGQYPQIMDTLMALPPAQPTVMLAHPASLLVAGMARERRPALRVAAVYLAPSNLASTQEPMMLGSWRVPAWAPHWARQAVLGALQRWGIDPMFLPQVNRLRQGFNLPPLRSLITGYYAMADVHLGLFPAWFARPQPDWPAAVVQGDFPRYDPLAGQALPAALREFLAQGEPPVVVTPGTANHQAAELLRSAMAGTQSLGRRSVVVTSRRDLLPETLPPHVLWQAYVSFAALLPHAAALVHHGGIGTTAEALQAGVPQLVLPLGFDQFANAHRLHDMGVACILPARHVTPERLAAHLCPLLDGPALRQRCQALSAGLPVQPQLGVCINALQALHGTDSGVGLQL